MAAHIISRPLTSNSFPGAVGKLTVLQMRGIGGTCAFDAIALVLQNQGHIVIFVGIGGNFAGLLAVADRRRCDEFEFGFCDANALRLRRTNL